MAQKALRDKQSMMDAEIVRQQADLDLLTHDLKEVKENPPEPKKMVKTKTQII